MKDASLYANCVRAQVEVEEKEERSVDAFVGLEVERGQERRGRTERTCWPRQMRGPALKGRKMNGFATRYVCTRPSRNLSGSKRIVLN